MGTTTTTQTLAFSEARRLVEEYASRLSPTDTESLPLLEALGLVLAQDLRADRDFPPFPRATRDGYAVRAEDVAITPATLRYIGEIRAGGDTTQRLAVQPGETVEIMTGAALPEGADSVVMIEYSQRHGDTVIASRALQAGENVVTAGAEARKGTIMVPRGTRANHATVAVAAAIGATELKVYRRPKVRILATGDELVDINLPPGPNQIRNSNSYSLAAQVHAAGGDPMILPVAADDLNELELLLKKGLEADLLLITGGVSMGKYDLVEQVLSALGAKFLFTGVRIQPGKPVVFGEVARDGISKPFFGLPGNPVSTMVTFQLFVEPLLNALSGGTPQPVLFSEARLKSGFRTKTGLTRFLPGTLSGFHERPEVELVKWQGSGDLMAVARSNCYIVVPPDRGEFSAGEAISILLF